MKHRVTMTTTCCQVIRSIGYKTVIVDRDVPCGPVTGVVPNVAGRVLDSECVCVCLFLFFLSLC